MATLPTLLRSTTGAAAVLYALFAPLRLLRALGHLFWGYWLIRSRFHRLSQEAREATVVHWSGQLIALLGLQLQVQGQPIKSGLLAANHASWLDILALHASTYCRFVAKSEIAKWPVIGYLTAHSGNIFVRRTKHRDVHRVVSTVAQHLEAQECIAVFPEGTTGDGRTLLPFHANMIESAVLARSVVQPVAITFVDVRTGERTLVPGYLGEETMLGSVWRTVRTPHLGVCVVYGEPQAWHENPTRTDRRVWAQELHVAVAQLLNTSGKTV